MSWLEEHLETFVRPYIKHIPNLDTKFFSEDDMRRIKNIWRGVKQRAKGKKLLLTGRDIFVFEILARRENYV